MGQAGLQLHETRRIGIHSETQLVWHCSHPYSKTLPPEREALLVGSSPWERYPPALAGKPKLIQRGCRQLTRLDTMGQWPSSCSDPAGFTSIDVVYDFLGLSFLLIDVLATYIWVSCNPVQPLCVVMAVSCCCSPNVTSSPTTFPFKAQDYDLKVVTHSSSNLWQERVHPYWRTPDTKHAKNRPSSEVQSRAQHISEHHCFSLQPCLNHISIQPLSIIPGGFCSSKKSLMDFKQAHTDGLCILSLCRKQRYSCLCQ